MQQAPHSRFLARLRVCGFRNVDPHAGFNVKRTVRQAISYLLQIVKAMQIDINLLGTTIRDAPPISSNVRSSRVRKKRAWFGEKWHLDEVFIKMNGVQHYLWLAVDQNGAVIDILVQPRRDRWAALRFFRKLLHTAERAPRVIITDKLRSYAAAKKLILPDVKHRQSRYLNNRAENSHQPTGVRERQMKRFQSPEHAQRFLCAFESINAPFRLRRYLLSAARHRRLLKEAFHLSNKTALAAVLP